MLDVKKETSSTVILGMYSLGLVLLNHLYSLFINNSKHLNGSLIDLINYFVPLADFIAELMWMIIKIGNQSEKVVK